jgi:hypothetical protein
MENTDFKLSNLIKDRQTQILDLKKYFDRKNCELYKEVINISNNLCLYEEMLNNKVEYKNRTENIIALGTTIGKILDINNPVKTVLIAIKIFEEHESYLKGINSKQTFLYKTFEKNDSTNLSHNTILKTKFNNIKGSNPNKDFYAALFKEDGLFYEDFNKYLNFQMDSKPNKENFKLDDFTSKMSKLFQGSLVNYFKFYNRPHPSFDLDYSSIVVSTCDIIFILYNKLFDKIFASKEMVEIAHKLDNYIYKHIIKILSDDLQKISEYIVKKDMDEMMKNLDRLYC